MIKGLLRIWVLLYSTIAFGQQNEFHKLCTEINNSIKPLGVIDCNSGTKEVYMSSIVVRREFSNTEYKSYLHEISNSDCNRGYGTIKLLRGLSPYDSIYQSYEFILKNMDKVSDKIAYVICKIE